MWVFWMVANVFLFALLFAWLVRRSLILITIEQNSMFPTLKPGDRVLATQWWPARWAKKGQIVLISLGEKRSFFVKRIVALPGETFDGDVLREQSSWQVPPGHFFVCGDNPVASVDSRNWGPIPFNNLRGRVILLLKNHSSY